MCQFCTRVMAPMITFNDRVVQRTNTHTHTHTYATLLNQSTGSCKHHFKARHYARKMSLAISQFHAWVPRTCLWKTAGHGRKVRASHFESKPCDWDGGKWILCSVPPSPPQLVLHVSQPEATDCLRPILVETNHRYACLCMFGNDNKDWRLILQIGCYFWRFGRVAVRHNHEAKKEP